MAVPELHPCTNNCGKASLSGPGICSSCRASASKLKPIPPFPEEGIARPETRSHSHYYKPVGHLKHIDVYRILDLYKVTDPTLQHIIKKALCAGQRGAKDFKRDVQEIVDTGLRKLSMMDEDEKA